MADLRGLHHQMREMLKLGLRRIQSVDDLFSRASRGDAVVRAVLLLMESILDLQWAAVDHLPKASPPLMFQETPVEGFVLCQLQNRK